MADPKEVTIHDVLDFINDPDLTLDNRRKIIEAVNRQSKVARSRAKAGFYVGQKVTWFSNRDFRQVVGRIRKVNRVNVDVIEDGSGMRWRCSPQLLKPAD